MWREVKPKTKVLDFSLKQDLTLKGGDGSTSINIWIVGEIMSMLLNIWIIGMILTFVWTMWTNHKKEEGDKSSMMEMAIGSVMWPFYFLYKMFHKLMG